MQRDFDRITNQLEAICSVLEQKANENQAITIDQACKIAKVSHSWICKIIDESDTFQIPSHLMERYEYAKCLIFDVITQEVKGVGVDRVKMVKGENGETETILDDSPMKIARSKLKLDASKWLYSRLMPRLLGDKVTVDSTNANNVTNNLVIQQVGQLDSSVLKALASVPLQLENK